MTLYVIERQWQVPPPGQVVRGPWEPLAYDDTPGDAERTRRAVARYARGADVRVRKVDEDEERLARKLEAPRVIWE